MLDLFFKVFDCVLIEIVIKLAQRRGVDLGAFSKNSIVPINHDRGLGPQTLGGVWRRYDKNDTMFSSADD